MTEPSRNIADSNTDFYDEEDVIARYELEQGWNDPGEMSVLLSIASAVRGKPILDIGIGTGRTTPLLRLLTDDYVGIDYAANMVKAAKSAFPGVDLRVGDVRDLRDFEDGSKELVLFSYNGLDSIDHEFRAASLANMARVVAPGGYLVYSTLNLESPWARRRPWTLPERPAGRGLEGLASWAARLAQWALRLPSNMQNLRRSQALRKQCLGWATEPGPGTRWRAVFHFTTVAQEKADLAATGLQLERVITRDGVDITDQNSTDAIFFYRLFELNRAVPVQGCRRVVDVRCPWLSGIWMLRSTQNPKESQGHGRAYVVVVGAGRTRGPFGGPAA